MGKIKKILENELIGGTQTTDVYPVTSTKAVYDENNERLDNIINKIEPGIIYDVSANNDGAVFESLSALLSSSNLSTLIPTSVRHGGMSIRFVQSSDNKYVQYRLISATFSTTESDWQGIDDVPTAESNNLVKSGGVFSTLYKVSDNLFDKESVTAGKYIEYNGQSYKEVNDQTMVTSDYIPVKAGVTYVVKAATYFYGTTNGRNVATFDANKQNYQRLPGTLKNNNEYIEFTAKRNGYIRFSVLATDKDSAMMVKGTTYPSEYIPYGTESNIPEINQLQDDVSKLKDDLSNLFIKGKNLFNKDSDGNVDGKFIEYSGSSFTLMTDTSMMTSDYIPVEVGKTYVVKAETYFYGTTQGRNIATFDTNKENYIRMPGTLKGNNSYIEFTADRNGYIRFSIYKTNADIAMIVEGTTYPSEYEPYGLQLNIPIDLKNDGYIKCLLVGKRVLWLGDSIGEAATAGEGVSGNQRFGWSGRIAKRYGGTFYSLARSGNTITKNVAAGVGSVLTKLEELYTYEQTGEYLIIEGGTNDADRIGSILDTNNLPAKFGSWTKTDYSGNYDEETFCGAVDSLFYKALTHYKGVKIGFLIAHKMGPNVNSTYFANRRAYFDVIKEMCKKWGIPCLDMWNNTWLNPALINHYDPSKNAQQNTDAGSYYTDGQHLTAVAYDYLATVIGKWMETL